MIQEQVHLPLRAGMGVVIQGIRIRLGRSLITILGVVLGVAFLVATLTGQTIHQAVRDEERLRTEVKRMASFLEAEIGPPLHRTVGVIQTGALTEEEFRLVCVLVDEGLAALRWHVISGGPAPALAPGVRFEPVALGAVGDGASGVLLLGAGPLPAALAGPAGMAALFDRASGKVLAHTREGPAVPAIPGVSVVGLARELTPEEVAKKEAEMRQARFRSRWILSISVLVTVAGIANAMLMSVTERFREIGTMKCLGALSGFIRWMFFFESSLIGAAGGAAGGVLGLGFSLVVYGFTYGYGAVFSSVDFARLALYLVMAAGMGVGLSVVAAIYPASVAARMVPAHALRTNV